MVTVGVGAGFGFQSLSGAVVWVSCRTTIIVDGKEYHRYDDDGYEVFGEVSPKTIDYLLEGGLL